MGVVELEKLSEYYREKKLAHAYLISTNNISKCEQVLLNVIKSIFCVNEYKENCNKCSLCHLIEINNLPSLKIIEPDGAFIKKEQILELKSLFSKESQFTKENIYIIKNAEKMNKESANTMLKFLEEPDGNVIGFFITKEKDNVLSTIQSRCQILEVIFDNNSYEKYGLNEEKYHEYLSILKEYLYKIEIERKKLLLYNKEYLTDYEKEDIKNMLQILLDIYQQELNSRYNIALNKNSDFSFLNNFTKENIKQKVNLIINLLNEISYNINLDMLLDKFVIEMDGINNETI